MTSEFEVKLERFSGPYVKLLELIEERKLSINEFSLAEVTDKYIAYIKELEREEDKSIIDISRFINVASTLMLIKAKSLFPNIVLSPEEESSVSDLEKKLELYKSMSEASKLINSIFNQQTLTSLSRFENKAEVFSWDERVDINLLYSIAKASLVKIPKEKKLREVAVKQVLKIEEVIEKLLTRVNQSLNLSFKEFSSSLSGEGKTLAEKKSTFIVSFLAMLELIKNGVLLAEQEENFEEINISSRRESKV